MSVSASWNIPGLYVEERTQGVLFSWVLALQISPFKVFGLHIPNFEVGMAVLGYADMLNFRL